jgi:hypothetical protein
VQNSLHTLDVSEDFGEVAVSTWRFPMDTPDMREIKKSYRTYAGKQKNKKKE